MCPILPNITNGSVDLSNGTVVGAIATYSCVPGYILEGDNRRTCQSNGQWNGREPFCRSKLSKFQVRINNFNCFILF